MSEKKPSNFPLRLEAGLKEDVRLLAGERHQTLNAFIVDAIENHILRKQYDLKSVHDAELISEMQRRFNVAITIQMTEHQIAGFTKYHSRYDQDGESVSHE